MSALLKSYFRSALHIVKFKLYFSLLSVCRSVTYMSTHHAKMTELIPSIKVYPAPEYLQMFKLFLNSNWRGDDSKNVYVVISKGMVRFHSIKFLNYYYKLYYENVGKNLRKIGNKPVNIYGKNFIHFFQMVL